MSCLPIFTCKKILALLFCLALLLAFASCGGNNADADADTTPEVNESIAAVHEPITEELIAILDANPDVKALLQKSIDAAKKINPDKKTNPAQTLEEYFDYVDWAAKALPWNSPQTWILTVFTQKSTNA